MKKTYVKPEVYFESFELSTSIATGCEYKTNHAKNECVYEIAGGRNVFVDAKTHCLDITAPGEEYGAVCYHVPIEASNLFTS